MHRVFSSRGPHPQHHGAPQGGNAGVGAAAAEYDQRRIVLEAPHATQPAKRLVVSGVRSRGEHDDAPGARAERRSRRRAVRCAGQRVRLVEHHDVPHERLEPADHLGALHVVDRCHNEAQRQPRVPARTVTRSHTRARRRVENDRRQPEASLQFALPLRAQAGGAHDERPGVGFPREDFRDDEPGLNRLSQADFVRYQQAAAAG